MKEFFKKFLSRKFLVWVVSTALTSVVIFTSGKDFLNSEFGKIIGVGYIIIAALYLLGESTIDLIYKLIDKTNININK